MGQRAWAGGMEHGDMKQETEGGIQSQFFRKAKPRSGESIVE